MPPHIPVIAYRPLPPAARLRPGRGERATPSGRRPLRQVVRQEVVARQLAGCLPDLPPRRVLDIGCGQGTQALLLARRGHLVAGLDSSSQLHDFRAALAAEPAEVGDRVRLVQGEAEAITDLFAPSSFDVVLCQGVLDDWDGADKAFDGIAYLNRIGVDARADRLEDLTAALVRRRMPVAQWYGVRVFTDTAASSAPLPDDATLDAILQLEERAGRTDPYRHVAALLHLIAVRGDETFGS